MKIERFEDIIAWQKAQRLALDVYAVFGKLKDFGFKDQICRAAISVSNNIAEGFDRSSDADFTRFLYMAMGSCSEVRSMIYLAGELDYIQAERKEQLRLQCIEISKIIKGLIKYMAPAKHIGA